MNGRRAIVGLCMLCALLVSAFAAQSASAITGTTAFTCVKGGGDKTLRGEHCLSNGSAEQNYGHVPINKNTTTELTGTNAESASETKTSQTGILKVTIAGVPLELAATGVSGDGWMENKETGGGEHYAQGEGTITFTGVTVKSPAGRGCEVFTHKEDGSGGAAEEGTKELVHTRKLAATTEGQGDNLNFKAADGGNFANFWVTCEEGKKIPAIEGTWSCSGSVQGQPTDPTGATTEFNHATVTTENKLKCKGTKAGIEGKLTLKARANSSDPYKPLSATTITT